MHVGEMDLINSYRDSARETLGFLDAEIHHLWLGMVHL